MRATLNTDTPLAPCDERLEGILAAALDDREAPRGVVAGVRRHLASCGRCSAYFASMKDQRQSIAQSDVWNDLLSRRQLSALEGFREFSRWLELSLQHASTRRVTQFVWRLASSILRLDVQYETHFPQLPTTIQKDHARFVRDAITQCGMKQAEHRAALERALQATELMSRDRSRGHRVRQVLKLLSVAEETVGDPEGRIAFLRASWTWVYGNADAVPGLLERVISKSSDTMCRSNAIGSLAVWHFDRGIINRALALNTAALLTGSGAECERWNRLVWEAMLGNTLVAESHRRSLDSSKLGKEYLMRYPGPRVRAIVSALARILDLSPSVAHRRITGAYALLGLDEATWNRTR
jgi:hypothetical protein